MPDRRSLCRHSFRPFIVAGLGATIAAAPLACSYRIAAQSPTHELQASLDSSPEPTTLKVTEASSPDPLMVTVTPMGIRATNPNSRESYWYRSMRVGGHIVANTTTLFVPLREQRLAALDRVTGNLLWVIDVRGEGLIGMSANDRIVTVSSMGSRGRDRVMGLDPRDGQLLWQRSTRGTFGTPRLSKGNVELTVTAEMSETFQRLTLDSMWGRELAREDAIVDGRDHSVSARTGSEQRQIEILSGPFPSVTGDDANLASFDVTRHRYDPGYDDANRIRWYQQKRPSTEGKSIQGELSDPNNGVLVARRSVVGVSQFTGKKSPSLRWSSLAPAHGEYVGSALAGTSLLLTNERGGFVCIDTRTGEMVQEWVRDETTVGSLFLDAASLCNTLGVDSPHAADHAGLSAARYQIDHVEALLADLDPRLLGIQIDTIRLVTNDPHSPFTAAVKRIATGELRPDDRTSSSELRKFARASFQHVLVDPNWQLKEYKNTAYPTAAQGPGMTPADWTIEELDARIHSSATKAFVRSDTADELCRRRDEQSESVLAQFAWQHRDDRRLINRSRAVEVALLCLSRSTRASASNVTARILADSTTDLSLLQSQALIGIAAK